MKKNNISQLIIPDFFGWTARRAVVLRTGGSVPRQRFSQLAALIHLHRMPVKIATLNITPTLLSNPSHVQRNAPPGMRVVDYTLIEIHF
jgi:hypothetical protein